MHFLKCSHCGKFTEVKSEYVTLCQHCEKKLDNHFRQWSERNPNKSFIEFKDLVCVTDNEVENIPKVKSPKSRLGLKFWIGFVFTAIVSTLVNQYFKGNLEWAFRPSSSSQNLLEATWTRQSYGLNAVTLEIPFQLDSIALPFTEDVAGLIDHITSNIKETRSGLTVMVNGINYVKKVGEVNLWGAAQGLVEEISNQPGVSELNHTEEGTFKDGFPGIIQKGTYFQNKTKMKFVNLIYGKDLLMYQITLGYRYRDKAAEEIIQRIMQSIEIKSEQ